MESIKELYKIGFGPSSSHTMGPYNAAEMFIKDCPKADTYTATLYGSLGLTGHGHFTDKAIERCFAEHKKSVHIEWRGDVVLKYHPNALKIEAFNLSNLKKPIYEMTYFSVGGGKVVEGEGTKNNFVFKEKQEKIIDVYGKEFNSFTSIVDFCDKEGLAIWEFAILKEGNEILDYMKEVWSVMCSCIERGLDDEGVLSGGLHVPKKASRYYTRSQGFKGILYEEGQAISYAYAVAEQNASLNTVVTAPTCGSAGIIPATLYSLKKKHNFSDSKIFRALLTGGVVGNVIKMNGSISGAEVGCQGEVGSACAMAGAAATQLMGGSIRQVEYAAELGLEHHLGLTCDPMMGLVQVPCIERNALGTLRALDHVTLSLLSSGHHLVSFDEVIKVMTDTGKSLDANLRETALGGLATLIKEKQ